MTSSTRSGSSAQLPSNPSLKHLRLEAKSVLKAHKGKDISCCKVLRHLRQFKDKPDDEILKAKVSLQEVQFALAMKYGFKNWTELKRHVDDRQSHDSVAVRPDLSSITLRGRNWRDDTSALVLQAVAALYGRNEHYEHICAISGNAFAPCMNTTEDQPERWPLYGHASGLEIVGNWLGLAMRGIEFPEFTGNPHNQEDHDRHISLCSAIIRQALQKGEIVIADGGYPGPGADYTSWAIVVEAPEGGKMKAACINGRTDNEAAWVQAHWGVCRKEPTLTNNEADIAALHNALGRIRGDTKPYLPEFYPGTYFGVQAIDVWANQMEQVPICLHCYELAPDRMWSCANGMADPIQEACRVAAWYLRQLTGRFEQSTRFHLGQAAQCYEIIAARLLLALRADGDESYRSIIGNAQKQRRHAQEVIRPCRNILANAADEIEKVLETMVRKTAP